MIINKIKSYWNDNGFEILVLIIITFLLLFGACNKIRGKRGTWSNSFYYSNSVQDFSIEQNIKKPKGKDSKGEIECRRVLEHIFRKPFNKSRPDFLRNNVTGGKHNLELDCFNSQLRLAVEYNGQQHYKYVPYFHRNREAFYNQKYRDEIKKRTCKDYNITLIDVPYTIKHKDIKNYLVNKLIEKGYKF